MKKIWLTAVGVLWILAGVQFLFGGAREDEEKVLDVLGNVGELETSAVLKYEGILKEDAAEETHLFLDLDFKEDIERAFLVQEGLEEELGPYVRFSDSSVNVIGSYAGRLTLDEQNAVVDEILEKLAAKVVTECRNTEFFTVYGYSPYISEYKMQKGQAVNINIAVRYGEEKDQTYIYAAVPVIGVEY